MDKTHRKAIVLILLAGTVVYANSLTNPFIWDDQALVKGNFIIKSWRNLPELFTTNLFYGSGSKSNFYRPLQSLSFMLDYFLWGNIPFGYHLSNLIFHSIVSLLFYSFVFSLSKDKLLSLIAALLFIVHPLHIEAVTYISGRAEPLVALFLLGSLLLFIKSRLLGSLIFFGLALLCKESALIFPLVLTFYVFCFPSAKRMKKSISLFFLLALIYILLRLTILCPVNTDLSSEYSLFIRLLFFLKAIGLYLSLLILPFNLHMSYSVILPSSVFNPQVLISSLLLIFVVLGLIRAYQERNRVIFFAGGWFFLFILPYSGIFPLNAFFAEHFLYLASMGFFLIVAVASKKLFRIKRAFIFLPLLALFFFAFLNMRYNFIWRNPLVFYQRIVRLSPNSFAAYNNLGVVLEERGFWDKAREMYEQAIRINPDFSEAYLNRGRLDFKLGQYHKAIEWYKKALGINPESSYGYMHLGDVHFSKEEFEAAIEPYQEALRLNPYLIKARNNLGIAYRKTSQYTRAIEEYRIALEMAPEVAEIYNNLGVVFSLKGNYAQAEEMFHKAMSLKPKYADASYNLAIVYWEQEKWDEVVRQLNLTLEIDPQHKLAKEQLDKLDFLTNK